MQFKIQSTATFGPMGLSKHLYIRTADPAWVSNLLHGSIYSKIRVAALYYCKA